MRISTAIALLFLLILVLAAASGWIDWKPGSVEASERGSVVGSGGAPIVK
jgi:hypothetical protein